MKKKVLMCLVLLTIFVASMVFAQGMGLGTIVEPDKDWYRCSYCTKEVGVKASAKAPSNTGLCSKNPSKISTAHLYKKFYDGKTKGEIHQIWDYSF